MGGPREEGEGEGEVRLALRRMDCESGLLEVLRNRGRSALEGLLSSVVAELDLKRTGS